MGAVASSLRSTLRLPSPERIACQAVLCTPQIQILGDDDKLKELAQRESELKELTLKLDKLEELRDKPKYSIDMDNYAFI